MKIFSIAGKKFKKGSFFFDKITGYQYAIRDYDESVRAFLCAVYKEDDSEIGMTQINIEFKSFNDLMTMEFIQY